MLNHVTARRQKKREARNRENAITKEKEYTADEDLFKWPVCAAAAAAPSAHTTDTWESFPAN